MHVDGDLALVDVLRVVVDDDAVDLAVLPAEVLRAENLVAGVLARDPNHVEKPLSDNAEAHQLLHFALLVGGQAQRAAACLQRQAGSGG